MPVETFGYNVTVFTQSARAGAFKRLLRGLVAAGLGSAVPAILEYVRPDTLEPVVGATLASVIAGALLALDKYVRAAHGAWGGLFGR